MVRSRFRHTIKSLLIHWPVALGILVWIALFSTFYSPEGVCVYADNRAFFVYTLYFLFHAMRGVYPVWNPLDGFGRPDGVWSRDIVDANPLLLLNTVFTRLGADVNPAYYLYLLVILALTFVGFYVLARAVLRRTLASQAAALTVIFSSFGWNLFNDAIIIFLVFSGVWFWYFLIRFVRNPSPATFTGAVFFLMLVGMTYLPFYFIIISLAVLACLGVTGALRIPVSRLGGFFSRHRKLSALGLLLVALSALPLAAWFMASTGGDLHMPGRGGAVDGDMSRLTLQAITSSNIIYLNDLRGQVSYLEALPYNNYIVPVMLYMIVAFALVLPVRRVTLVLLASWLAGIIIGLGDVTPVFGFLYTHVPFFSNFRNLHFTAWLIFPLLALAVGSMVVSIQGTRASDRRPWWAYGSLIAVSAAGSLVWLGGVSWGTVASAFASGIFLTALCTVRVRTHAWAWQAVLLAALAVQAAPLFFAATRPNTLEFFDARPYAAGLKAPVFSAERVPSTGAPDVHNFGDGRNEARVPGGLFQTRWAFELGRRAAPDQLARYVREKFVAYSGAVPMEDSAFLEEHLSEVLALRYPHAAVSGTAPEELAPQGAASPRAVREGEELKVEAFDLDRIRLRVNFPRSVFLVYNDSYSRSWRLTVDGKAAALYRANYAFKGFRVPAGEHVIALAYRPPLQPLAFWLAIAAVWAGGALFLVMRFRRR